MVAIFEKVFKKLYLQVFKNLLVVRSSAGEILTAYHASFFFVSFFFLLPLFFFLEEKLACDSNIAW